MKNSNFNLYSVLILLIIIVIAILIFERRKRIKQKEAKEHFLVILVFTLISLVFSFADDIFLNKDQSVLFHILYIIVGLVYGNIEFYVLKKRLKDNKINNTFFIPSFIFAIIMSMVFSIIFLPFINILDHHLLRGKLLSFIVNFLFGYSFVLYWRFRRLERTVGTIYFEKRVLGFLKSRNKGNN